MTTIQLRRGTAKQWKDADPVLAAGEPGWDLDSATLKVGDGTRRWSELSPVHLGAAEAAVDSAVARAATRVAEGGHRAAWDAVAARSRVAPVRVLFLGSSTTYGNHAKTENARYVNQVVLRAQAQYPATGGQEVPVRSLSQTNAAPGAEPGIQGINGSTGGVTSAGYCPSLLLYTLNSLDVSFAIHMIGSNDSVAGMPLTEYRDNVRRAVTELAKRGVRGQLLVHTYRRREVDEQRWAEYGKVLAEVAAGTAGVGVLDVSGIFENLSHLDGDPLKLIDDDTVHMTDAGHALMGEQVARALGVTARPRQQGRPPAYAVPVGTVHMDSTTRRPLFSTGTTWVDATGAPWVDPTEEPSPEPTVDPSPEPTAEPTPEATPQPTSEPTAEPTAEPTPAPTSEPTGDGE